MKNIVFVIESLHLGGAEKSLVTLLKNLDYSKYKVDLITFHKDGFFVNEIPNEVNHIVLTMPSINMIERVQYSLKRKLNKGKFHHAQLFWEIISKRLISIDRKYDVAIAYNQGFTTYFTNQCIDAPIKYTWLNTDYKKAGYDIDFDFPIYQQFDKVITVSSEAFESLNKELQKTKKYLEVEIVKDISDLEEIRKKSNEALKYQFKTDSVKITSVGRLVKPKGFQLAIKACEILVDKGYHPEWIIVGEGNERAQLESLIKENQLENNFKLLGSDINPYPYMKACDIYVQTSLFEGLGLTVIEATYLQKPMVCTNFPTAFGILNHEETGLICEMNAISIADSIERLINDKELRNELVNNLEKEENKDKERTLEQIEQLLNL